MTTAALRHSSAVERRPGLSVPVEPAAHLASPRISSQTGARSPSTFPACPSAAFQERSSGGLFGRRKLAGCCRGPIKENVTSDSLSLSLVAEWLLPGCPYSSSFLISLLPPPCCICLLPPYHLPRLNRSD
ncbi:hypothetical protein DPEC_G00359250 [Dallia pectoralis]|uniref:Uncharacterized protein n=1 Tax=Dallia pectoralis TaxID=75939 RepID=A0ACC2F0F3_DALPE|nr:hypothetical protein DPEC_G00359250 [Dallia pectoralis]